MGFFDFLYNRRHIKPVNQSSISGNGMLLNQTVPKPGATDVEFSRDVSPETGDDDKKPSDDRPH